jgi:hypothetical protein
MAKRYNAVMETFYDAIKIIRNRTEKTENKFHQVVKLLLKTIKEDWVNGL